MHSRVLVLVALAIASTVSAAQSPIMRPKQQAQRAVDQTNAHTRAMTDTSVMRTPQTAPSTTATAAAASDSGLQPTPKRDTTRARVTTSKGSTANKPERGSFEREIFSYERAGRRDPFISLMTTSEIRPLLPDLRLVGIAYDPTGRNSVAVLREDAQDQNRGPMRGTRGTADVPLYRVKEGQQLGRMRVARIGPHSVTFTIEEFGYSRQESLTLSASNTEKKP
jgi:hypothetical protein